LKFIERLSTTVLPVSCITALHIARNLSCNNKHQEAYGYLLKAVCFDRGFSFIVNQDTSLQDKTSDNFTDAHKLTKSIFPQILNTLMHLNKKEELDSFIKYLKKEGINVQITKRANKSSAKANQHDVSNIIRKELISSIHKESSTRYEELKSLMQILLNISSQEWNCLKDVDAEALIEKAREIFETCTLNFEKLNKTKEIFNISKESLEKTRIAQKTLHSYISQFHRLVSKHIAKIYSLRKKEEARKHYESSYQTNETAIYHNKAFNTHGNGRVSQKLLELQREQKQALIETKQKLRKESRQSLQEEYQKNSKGKESIEDDIPPHTLLIKCDVLPEDANDYSNSHSILLHSILSNKFNLDDKDQETLRVILMKGTRYFAQIGIIDIKRLISKFDGFIKDVHHGGNHERISGMGITFMPNANGIKKGSYFGQIEQVREKIIRIIATELTVSDLPNEDTCSQSQSNK
jgi:hypothetical protein